MSPLYKVVLKTLGIFGAVLLFAAAAIAALVLAFLGGATLVGALADGASTAVQVVVGFVYGFAFVVATVMAWAYFWEEF